MPRARPEPHPHRAPAWARAAAAAALVLGVLTALAGAAAPAARAADGERATVLVAPLTGAVDPVMDRFVEQTISRARAEHAAALVFELDTPGGLSTSMDDIVDRIVRARDLPVLVWVGPDGARAASAGVFITYASDVAAMAPGTNIGSATPISSGGQELPKDLRRKVLNDSVASITELARERGRDVQFAEDAIREARNVGAADAVRLGVVEHRSTSVRQLLRVADGARVEPKGLRLDGLAAASIERIEPSLALRVLKHVVDPNVLFLLFGAGVIGLAFELTHPGVVLPGVAGGICLLVALFGLSVLPATGAGIALLVLAAALFSAEAIAPGGGVLGAGGAAAMLVGALLLFDERSGYGVSPVVAVGMAAAFAGFFGIVLRKAIATRRFAPTTSGESLIDRIGVVRRPPSVDRPGAVFVDGELWQATGSPELRVGDAVRVIGLEGLLVRVEANGAPGVAGQVEVTP